MMGIVADKYETLEKENQPAPTDTLAEGAGYLYSSCRLLQLLGYLPKMSPREVQKSSLYLKHRAWYRALPGCLAEKTESE